MKNSEIAAPAEADAEVDDNGEVPFLHRITGQTPWWIISVMLHTLVIVMACLLSATYEFSDPDPAAIMVTEIMMPKTPEKPAAPTLTTIETLNMPAQKLADKFDGPMTQVKAVMTEELMKLAEISDRDRSDSGGPEDGGFKGEPNGTIMYLPEGRLGEVGGGGRNGFSESMDVIGLNDTGSAGDGGGYLGGHGNGVGNATGPGSAGLGNSRTGSNRLTKARRYGGGPDTEITVNAALQWLAYHQEADGHWDTKKFGASNKSDTAVTGLALLAFLGNGHSERVGHYADVVKSAVKWLKSKQDASGLIWDSTDDGARHRAKGYPGAIATLAIAEAAGMANVADTRAAAQRAIDYCTEQHQNGDGSDRLGWRYGPKEAGDLSVSGWYIMALKSAKVAGLHVNPAAFDGALRFLATLEHPVNGSDSSYGPPSTFWYTQGEEHAASSHRLTAIGVLARQFTGTPISSLQSSVDLMVEKGGVPDYGANGEKVDLYYWYYASMAVFQQGPTMPLWKKWNVGLKKTLTDNQIKQGDDLGSWNPVGEFSGEWGRAGQTALGALCMEVYYRYGLVGAASK